VNHKGEGWLLFSSIALGISGVMRIFDGVWALSYHGAVPNGLQGAVFGADLRTYGWIYLVEGIVLILASAGVVVGSQVSRWIGIVAGSLVCISAIWLMPFYPVWAVTYIILGVLVVYGLAVYGGDALT
jgi:hypothetical protein